MFRITLAATGLLLVAAPAVAQDRAAPAKGGVSVEQGAFGPSAPVAETDLKAATGREDIARSVASATQRNTVAGNSVTGNSVTGNVALDGNAFQNLQGLAVINANSGNNVAINSAMNVTINLAPAP